MSRYMMLLEYVNTATDLYNTDVSDDKFVTIANNNKTCQLAVKTPWGTNTQRKNTQLRNTGYSSSRTSVFRQYR